MRFILLRIRDDWKSCTNTIDTISFDIVDHVTLVYFHGRMEILKTAAVFVSIHTRRTISIPLNLFGKLSSSPFTLPSEIHQRVSRGFAKIHHVSLSIKYKTTIFGSKIVMAVSISAHPPPTHPYIQVYYSDRIN